MGSWASCRRALLAPRCRGGRTAMAGAEEGARRGPEGAVWVPRDRGSDRTAQALSGPGGAQEEEEGEEAGQNRVGGVAAGGGRLFFFADEILINFFKQATSNNIFGLPSNLELNTFTSASEI